MTGGSMKIDKFHETDQENKDISVICVVLRSLQIDHATITYKNDGKIMNVQIERGVIIDSDHYFKSVKISQPPKTMNK